jgi:ring-1,2-phenylacetyl-CoA epoxidase subunit PaaD
MQMPTVPDIYHWLEEVKDPEIPVLSLVDLGVITSVAIHNGKVQIEMTPTFVGCPALDLMQQEITEALAHHNVHDVHIVIQYHAPWSSDRITEKGRRALQEFGLAPPVSGVVTDLDILEKSTCPRCQGSNTELRNLFGATRCRSIHYCYDCREAFEQFKTL